MYTLRPQQVEFVHQIRQAFAQRNRAVLAVAPTGFGKGVVVADMAARAIEKGNRALVVTNRRQIVKQLTEHCTRNGIHVGVVMGAEEPDEEAPLQIASIQTLQRREFPHEPEFIIIDEAHQQFNAYKKLIHEQFPQSKCLGLTATPVGAGGAKLDHFEVLVEPIRNSEVIAVGDLLRVHPYLAPSEPDMGGIDLKRASSDEIGQRVEECTVYGDVFKLWEPYRHLQTLVTLPSRATCNQFHRMCAHHKIRARVVDGTTNQDDRDEAFREFRYDDCDMILGVDVIREGLDLPIAQCLIDLQPTQQFRVYWQKLGRVKRPHPGQEFAVVIDLAGNLWRHMVHPDQDPPWSELTNDNTIEEVIEKQAGVRCPQCGSKDIYGPIDGMYKCEACKHTWATRKPWVCPQCHQGLAPWQKVIGGVCPNCGAQVSVKPIRRIRMKDGSFRTIPADEVKRRKKKNSESAEQEWLKWVFIARNWNRKNPGKKRKSLNWCGQMYKKERGVWPKKGMKYVPTIDSDWERPPEAVWDWLGR